MFRKPVIAIDGPAASGKSTTARLVAQKLGYLYIDTGAMYRAAGLKALRLGISFSDREAIGKMMDRTDISQKPAPLGPATFLDGVDVSGPIRSPEVSQAASDISAIPSVRQRLVKLQQQMGRKGGVVMEGRDITTVVFPNAEVKVFMQASVRERAHRRKAELEAHGMTMDLKVLEKQIETRDRQDSQRDDSPLTCTPDSLVIDTSTLTIDQQVEMVIAQAEKVMKAEA
ncbi:(d)CMP kinase [candidate division TA06 bacterium]|uniref:Cytidylate kinase n=1 Tax=candidate division TA06 bacterium TaxID=2250710 RepID=A0A933MKF6_UNCT6|nr:(d)CMP kinase [candidate division TA06 bacterium]